MTRKQGDGLGEGQGQRINTSLGVLFDDPATPDIAGIGDGGGPNRTPARRPKDQLQDDPEGTYDHEDDTHGRDADP